MARLNKLIIAIAAIMAFAFILSPVSLAKSNLPEPLQRTNNLMLGYKGSKIFDGQDYINQAQYSYYQRMFLADRGTPWKCGKITREDAKASFDKAIRDKGDWIITQFKTDWPSNYPASPIFEIRLYWSEKALPVQELRYNAASHYHFIANSNYRYLILSLNGVYCGSSNQGVVMDGVLITLSMAPGSAEDKSSISLYLSTPKYKLGKGLEGVDPDDLFLPDSADQKLQPDFLWTVDEKLKLNVTYMNNVLEFNNSNPKLEPYLKWHWVLRHSDEKRADGELLDDTKSPVLGGYDYQLPIQGIYKLEVSLDDSDIPLVIYPRPDFSWIKKRIFIIEANGQFRIGDTFSGHCDENGVCVANPIDCDSIKDVFRRVQCRMDKQFGSGVLNPSLLSLRRLMSSFIVAGNPTCGLNIPSPPGRFSSFNPRVVVSDVCVRSREFRRTFPITTVIVNFSAALFFLWIIVRIFNSLTNHRKDDMIGDV